LGKEQLSIVEALVMAQPDALLEELCERFAEQTGVRGECIDDATGSRLKFSVKKTFIASEQDSQRVKDGLLIDCGVSR